MELVVVLIPATLLLLQGLVIVLGVIVIPNVGLAQYFVAYIVITGWLGLIGLIRVGLALSRDRPSNISLGEIAILWLFGLYAVLSAAILFSGGGIVIIGLGIVVAVACHLGFLWWRAQSAKRNEADVA